MSEGHLTQFAEYAAGDRVLVTYFDSPVWAEVVAYETRGGKGGNGATLTEPYLRVRLPESLKAPGLAAYRVSEVIERGG